jgi:sialate O-acetylesterase
MQFFRTTAAALASTLSLFRRADIRLPKILTDHMLLRRDVPIHVWGWALPGERVQVSIENDSGAKTGDIAGGWNGQHGR